ncbi:Transposase IS116/IS110/IS902 family protein [Rhodoblastus acidophilus]|uniref:Transposase IS116/IS110/IS902 family protein n=1 Tax=Rhodoblastus acidophilus TaxID=1074 RepID=A0A212SB27_RHOAC|nr:Transposase IS116/IS110/IS902 family protein [Rhodoblastus acidophilus]
MQHLLSYDVRPMAVHQSAEGGCKMAEAKSPAVSRFRAERLETRVTVDQKRLIEHAAALQGRSVTDFVLTSLQDAARRAIEEHQYLALSVRDSEAFVQALTKQVLAIVRQEKICRRLMSAPGVGPITALAYRATIDRPERFRHSRDVGAHLGLTPARYQSGETDIQGKISRCGDELARTALYRRRIACSCAARNGQACEHGA